MSKGTIRQLRSATMGVGNSGLGFRLATNCPTAPRPNATTMNAKVLSWQSRWEKDGRPWNLYSPDEMTTSEDRTTSEIAQPYAVP